MARIETDPNYNSPTFSRATAATDLFKKEDVQNLAAAMSTHDHTNGKGLPLVAGSIPNGTITSAMIADATIDTADLKDGAVTSAKIADGTVATVDLANQAVTNAKLGSDTARANLLTNGGFEIWQRGNGPFSGGTALTADMWTSTAAGGGTWTVSKETSIVDAGSQASLKVVHTFGSAFNYLRQGWTSGLKASDFAMRGRTFAFSVRVNASVANAISVRLATDGTGALDVESARNAGSGTWETLTIIGTVPTDATLLCCDIRSYSSNTFYIDNAMLVVGSVAADYAPLHPADDLARCLRYYEAITVSSTGAFATGQAASATAAVVPLQFQVQKPVSPTITFTAGSTFAMTNAATTALGVTSMSYLITNGRVVYVLVNVASGLVAGNASVLQAAASQTAIISIEANP